jgi:transposase-like protein
MKELRTLQQAIVYFSDPDRAFQYALNFRWPNGLVSCPRCGSENHSFIKTRRIWFCYGCKKQFSLKVGTIFEDSPITLDKWMLTMWMLANCKNGVSSYEIARNIGVMQRSAWFMLHRIRKAMELGSISSLMGGPGSSVEIDESFVGGKMKNMHKAKAKKIRAMRSGGTESVYGERKDNKASVLGIFDRTSREVRAKVVPNVKRETLQNEILRNVKHGTNIYTDEAVSYNALRRDYIHETVNHADAYVRGQVHTNCLENFWSLMKRNLAGTYVAVEPFHLDRYLSEQVFRFNNRVNMDDEKRFEKVLSQIAGKRLTYAELTGVGASTSH